MAWLQTLWPGDIQLCLSPCSVCWAGPRASRQDWGTLVLNALPAWPWSERLGGGQQVGAEMEDR